MIKLFALKLVHFLITLAQIAFSTCIWLHCLLKDVRSSAFGGQNVTLYSVRLDARYLTKIPDHMALVVGEEAVSYNDLVSCWGLWVWNDVVPWYFNGNKQSEIDNR